MAVSRLHGITIHPRTINNATNRRIRRSFGCRLLAILPVTRNRQTFLGEALSFPRKASDFSDPTTSPVSYRQLEFARNSTGTAANVACWKSKPANGILVPHHVMDQRRNAMIICVLTRYSGRFIGTNKQCTVRKRRGVLV